MWHKGAFSQIVNAMSTAQVLVKLYLYVNSQKSHALFFFNDGGLLSYYHFGFLDFCHAFKDDAFAIDNW